MGLIVSQIPSGVPYRTAALLVSICEAFIRGHHVGVTHSHARKGLCYGKKGGERNAFSAFFGYRYFVTMRILAGAMPVCS